MQQAQIILRLLFVPHQQLAETVQPRMRSFHPPSAGRLLAPADRFGFPADLPHMRNITAFPHNRRGGLATVAFIGTQVLATPTGRLGSPNHNAVQCLGQQFHIMPVGPADDKRERDASPVHQQTAFGAFFPPDPWGCCPPLPAPRELCPGCRQCSAIPKQSLPDRRIRPNRPATVAGRIPPRATAESDGEPPWHCQNSWAKLSTDNPSATHTQWRRTPNAVLTACARLRDAAGIFDLWLAPRALEPAARPESRVHRRLPKSKLCSCRQPNKAHIPCKAYLGISSKALYDLLELHNEVSQAVEHDGSARLCGQPGVAAGWPGGMAR